MGTQLTLEILDDIFGKKIGTAYMEGLVDASDNLEFEVKTAKAITKWRNATQASGADVEAFIAWFVKHKVPAIQQSMLRTVREECGLGSPPISFTTNACEAANSVLKKQVNYQRNELPEFIHELRELVQEQEREFERAIISRGKYVLRPQYASWQLAETKWFAMSTEQRERHLKRFATANVSDVSTNECTFATASVFGRSTELGSSLSVAVEDFADDVRTPRNCLEGIWAKAGELLQTDD